ncbi:hypothetical protein LR48_Vigan11g063700 [Vigna angularis]|uniref:Uncharacterized protein n=1 Tax=Phaseolus angularis TaxID=3914 RepID=A0A0L9VS82_PHAAN|nr:hypothetical protein LR48_Vigan11g063700 [Vigna angularis]
MEVLLLAARLVGQICDDDDDARVSAAATCGCFATARFLFGWKMMMCQKLIAQFESGGFRFRRGRSRKLR